MVPVVTSRGGASRRRRLLLLTVARRVGGAVLGRDDPRVRVPQPRPREPRLEPVPRVDPVRASRSPSTTRPARSVDDDAARARERLAGLPAERAVHRDRRDLARRPSERHVLVRPDPRRGAAGLGLVLGFLSLYLVQTVVAERVGRVAGWTVAMAALVLSGLGVYLGRYERWNSWEVLTEPGKIFGGLASGLADPMAYSKPIALSAFFASPAAPATPSSTPSSSRTCAASKSGSAGSARRRQRASAVR